MTEEDKKVNEAARLISKYCAGKNTCVECIFESLDDYECPLTANCPSEWIKEVM